MNPGQPYSLLHKTVRYFEYLKKSKSRHGIHSPFIYDLIEKVLRNPLPKTKTADLEIERKYLLKDNSVIFVEDFGVRNSRELRIKDIAAHSLKENKYASILGRMAEYYPVKSIIELGTSLGITTGFLARSGKPVLTIEGSEEILNIAQKVWKDTGTGNIRAFPGKFDDKLPPVWQQAEAPVMAFIDGNHTRKATLEYFNFFISRMTPDSFIVFDDIHWSPGMEQAWETIVNDKRVSLSVDIFEMGMAFLNQGVEKQHFIIRF